ncbi:hypothetical protein VOM14_15985 [Paraburkholderia sp. MPAMCS5]|nr:hypothetical protein [Paraburkholderia sp. MPAMCS5]
MNSDATKMNYPAWTSGAYAFLNVFADVPFDGTFSNPTFVRS